MEARAETMEEPKYQEDVVTRFLWTWQLHHHLTAAVVSAQDQPCQQSTVDWRWLTKHHQQAEELVAVHGCSGREPFSFSAPTEKGPVLHSCSVSNSSDISGHRRDMNTEEELGKN